MDPLKDLVDRARRGDRPAFEDLFHRLGRPLFFHLFGLLGREEDADDALQSAFLSAWTKLPALRRTDRFVPWLFHIGRNAALDLRRRARTRRAEERDLDRLEAPAGGASTLGDVRHLVGTLRPQTRALVLLRAVEGWSAEAVGEALGLHVATVRRRYARALAHLRLHLEGRSRHDARR